MPPASFYNSFYELLWQRYSSYEEMPAEWREKKIALADLVARVVRPGGSVLSIGCGIGYVETVLAARGFNVRGIEPCSAAARLAAFPIERGYFPELPSERPAVDAIVLLVIDYAFDAQSWAQLLRDCALYPADRTLIVSCSVYRPRSWPRRYVRLALDWLGRRQRQYWGVQRTTIELLHACTAAGLKVDQEGWLQDGSFWISCSSANAASRSTPRDPLRTSR